MTAAAPAAPTLPSTAQLADLLRARWSRPGGLTDYARTVAFELPVELRLGLGPHQLRAFAALEAAATGTGPARIILTMPPQHGKTWVLRVFLSWLALTRPRWRTGYASYAADLSIASGRVVRDMTSRWGHVFGVGIRPDQRARADWGITLHGQNVDGGMISVGRDGALTGRPLQGLIIDDLLKNAKEARSRTIRDECFSFWTTTGRTRIQTGGFAVVVATRWDGDDLTGRLLRRTAYDDGSEPEEWLHIHFPALATTHDILGREPGAPLWARKYDLPNLLTTRASISTFDWQALYQGEPMDPTGNGPISDEALSLAHSHQMPPDELLGNRYLGVDPSFSSRPGADWTGIFSARPITGTGQLVLDGDHSQRLPLRRIAWRTIYDTHPFTSVVVETNLLGDESAQQVRDGLRDAQLHGVAVIGWQSRGAKIVRHERTAAWCFSRGLWIPVATPQFDAQALLWKPSDSDSPDRVDAATICVEYHAKRLEDARGSSVGGVVGAGTPNSSSPMPLGIA